MNISQLLRGMIGDMQVSDARTLELKVGQIVRGVVLQMLSEQDALMNIGGAQVQAHLEAPLAKGQSALLQVQPESMAGKVVLKPVEVSQVQIPEPSLAELLKSFDLKDTPANRRALQDLHQAKLPLTRENVQSYAQMAASQPEGAADGEWRQSALLAMKRGLPLTQETVASLHRTVFGGGVGRTIEHLGSQLAGFLASDATTEAAVSPATRQLMAQVKQALEALPALPQAAGADAGAASAAGPRTAGEAAQAARADAPAAGARPAAAGEAAAQPKAAPPAAEQAATAARTAGGAEAAPASAGPPRGEAAAAGAHGARAAAGGQEPGGAGEAPAAALAREPAPWVGRLLKALGVQHELQLARPHEGGAQAQPPHTRAGEAAPPPAGTAPPPEADAAADTATLKGLLLQLSAADDAPPAIREQAQQLVQQVTGQQLLLTPDRTAMFTHMTLMLPIMNQHGSQTAAVHIQSRKGANGQLDARNCHLVFDLDMRTLGTTLVDVQVTDRIVALRVHNDFPEIGELLEEHREEIREGLDKIGYQLLSVKVLPYPEPLTLGDEAGGDSQMGDHGPTAASWAASRYHSTPYKGVDVRI